MSKINVYSSSASNAIKVFDASSTGLKPDNAILVTTGTEPSNAIQINIGEQKWSSIAVNFGGQEPTPPGPTWKTVTVGDNVWMAENLKYDDGENGIFISAMKINGVDFGEQYYYNIEAVQRISASFPGWHIATYEDYNLLKNEVEGNCESLRSTSGWYAGNNGNNLKGFNAEPLGENHNNDIFYSTGVASLFTCINNSTTLGVSVMKMNYNNSFQDESFAFLDYYNIRLVKDHE